MARKVVHNKRIVFPYVPAGEQISEAIKGEVTNKKVTFPKELGCEHPFKFEQCEETYKKFGLAKTAVDKHLDFIFAQGFHIEAEDEKSKELIRDLIDSRGFVSTLRQWIQEAFIKGNGFMEVAVDKTGVQCKVISANDMYVQRDHHGVVTGYNQYTGGLNKFSPNKVIAFKPSEIAHYPMGKVGDDPYGLGIIYPALKTIDNIARSDRDEHILMSRKANSPIIATLGSPEEPATQGDVDSLGQKLVYLNNLHEWAFSHHVKVEALDFGNIGDKFTPVLEHDKQILFEIFQIPEVLMGHGNIAEGLAKVQMDAFDRRIQSIQDEIEEIIEEQIFEPYLKAQGLKTKVEITWGQASEDQKNTRLTALNSLLGNMSMSPELKAQIEEQIAITLDLDLNKIPSPEEARAEKEQVRQDALGNTNQTTMPNKERKKEENLKQPEVPGTKRNIEMKESEMTLTEFVNLNELTGFNYKDYLKYVVDAVERDKFEDLLAKTQKEIDEGKLTQAEVERLKTILKDAFVNNQSIRQIEQEIQKSLDLTGARNTEADRANMIARTETVRMTNIGLLDMYSDNGLKEVRFMASISDRTCEECMQMSGQIKKLNESYNIIPVHPSCRCVWIGVENAR